MPVYDDEKLDSKPKASEGEHDSLGMHPEHREAEASEWQNRFDQPSAKSSPISSEDLEAAEVAAASPDSATDATAGRPDDQVGEGYKPLGAPKRRGRISRRQKIIGGGAAGILATALIGVILQGPLQFMHFAQILARHTSQLDNIMDDQQLARVRYRRRLGIAGNKAADIVESKLNKAGYTSKYDPNGGYFVGFSIDPTKVDIGALEGLGAEINIDTTTGEAVLTESGANFKRRRLVNGILESADLRYIPSRVSSRLLRKRGGVSFKLLGNLDRKAYTTTKSYQDAVLQKFKEYYKSGGPFRLRANSDSDKNDDGTELSDEEKARRQNDNDGFQNEADRLAADPSDPNVEGISNEVDSGKFGAKSTDALGFFCAAKAIGRSYQVMQHARIIMPLIRLGTGYTSIGNQVMSNRGTTIEELGAYNSQLYDKKDETSWSSARSIQYELGQDLTGPDMPASSKPGRIGSKPAFFETIDRAPLGTACKINDSTIGGIGISIVTGGFVSELFFTALSSAGIDPIGKLVQGAISWAVGQPLKDLPKGALLGNYANYGSRLATNDRFISVGGRELSDEEAVALRQETLQEEREHFAGLPLGERLFGANQYSLLSQASIQTSGSGNLTNFAVSFIKLPGSVLSGFINKKVLAAQSYDYGFPLFGFTVEEKNSDAFANPYLVDEKAEPRLAELNEKYGKCFATTIDPTTKAIATGETVNYYAPEYEKCQIKPKHPEYNDFTLYRFYILGKVNERAVECYGGIEDSCKQVGYGSGGTTGASGPANTSGKIVGDPYTESSGVPCAEGTKDLGTQDGYQEGRKYTVRLCSLPNLTSTGQADRPGSGFSTPGADGHAIVNSRVSGAWFSLVNDAIAAGMSLSAYSSFRSMPHQQSLWESNGRNPSRVAPPGNSSHQAGVAIDFNKMPGFNSSGSCTNRARTLNNPAWVWLRDNAERYGFKQFSNEAWHWDALPANNRCGASQP